MKKILLFTFLPLSLFAAGSGSGEYDILPRAVNFLIFVAILYYLLANPVKNFYKSRITSIASRLEDIQKKLLESRNKKLEAIKKFEDFKKEAANSILLAKKEAELLAQKVKNDTKNELLMLEKAHEEQKLSETRKMEKEVVSKMLKELFSQYELSVNQKDIVDIMFKKVS